MLHIAVLASTNGTDLTGIFNAIESKQLNVKIEAIISNKECHALDKARDHNVPAHHIDPGGKSKEEFDLDVAHCLQQYNVELVILVGYMKIITPTLLDLYPDRIFNVHPSLLPAFAGGMDMNVHEEVLASGVEVTGATIHLVTKDVDAGPIIMQQEVHIEPGETPDSLKHKVQEVEQQLYIQVLQLYEQNKLTITNGVVSINE